jgi:hypothetical protein
MAMSASGFIYVLENESMPGIVKIGMTTRLPEARAAELWTTGVPTPFTIAFSIYCEACSEYESAIHQEFSYCRVNESREFFEIDTKKAIAVITQEILCDQYGLCVVDAECYVPEKWFDAVATACEFREPWMVSFAMRFFTKQEWLAAWERAAASRKQSVELQSTSESAEVDHG